MQNIKKKFWTQIPKHLQRMTHPSLNFAGLLCNFESLLFCFLLKAMYPVVKPGMHLFHWIILHYVWIVSTCPVTLVGERCLWNLVRPAIGTLGGTMLPTNDLSSRPFASLTCHRAVSHWPRLGESEEQVKECRSNTSLYSAHNSFVSWAQNQKQERNHAGEWSVTRMGAGQGGWAECQDMRVARPAGCLQLPPSVSVTVRDPRWNLDPGPARNPSHVTFAD